MLAALVTYPVMNLWLEDFAYRIAVNPLVFPLSALVVISVAYATMLLQSLRLSNLNPVYTLRYE